MGYICKEWSFLFPTQKVHFLLGLNMTLPPVTGQVSRVTTRRLPPLSPLISPALLSPDPSLYSSATSLHFHRSLFPIILLTLLFHFLFLNVVASLTLTFLRISSVALFLKQLLICLTSGTQFEAKFHLSPVFLFKISYCTNYFLCFNLTWNSFLIICILIFINNST